MDPRDRALRALARTQHNLVTSAQLADIGFTKSAAEHRRRTGALEHLGRGVHRIGGVAPTSPYDSLAAALLMAGAGAAIAYDSAASHWLLPGYELLPPHVLVDRTSRVQPHPSYRLHRTRVLGPQHLTVVDGLLFTTPARTARDLAGALGLTHLGAQVDRLLSRHLSSPVDFREAHLDLQKRGRAGTVKSRAVAQVRGPGYVAPESGLEGRANHLLVDWYGFSAWRRQVDTGNDDRWIGRVDFRHRFRPVIIEIQSRLFHGSLTDVEKDDVRSADLVAAGFEVAEIPEDDVWYHPERFRASVDAALARAQPR